MGNSNGNGNGGAKSKYDEKYVNMALVACSRGGFTDCDLAKLFSVSKATITNWKKLHPEFLASIKNGKDIFDCGGVENSLLKRCMGYQYSEITKELTQTWVKDGKGKPKQGPPKLIVTKVVEKHMAPDTKAIDIWLCNRNPLRWRKLKHVEVAGPGGGPIETKTHAMDDKSLKKAMEKK